MEPHPPLASPDPKSPQPAPRASSWPSLLVAALALGVALVFPGLSFPRYLFVLALLVFGWTRRSLSAWIVVAMGVGGVIGLDFVHWGEPRGIPAEALQVPSKIFIRLVKTIVAPLLFSTLVIGIASHADVRTVGRLGFKSIVYFELVTTVALFVGLAAINISRAGEGIPESAAVANQGLKAIHKTPIEIILHTFPENIAKSVAEGDVLQVVVFSVLFGSAMAFVSEEKRRPLLEVIESLAETMFKFTGIIMNLAPWAVGSAVAYTVATMGLAVMKNLALLLFTLYVSLAIFVVFVLLPILFFSGVPLVPFLRCVSEPASIAFATSTSEAALPGAMERLEQLGVPRHVVSFVLPLGYSFNLDGTTLYLALASVFVAQASGHELSLGTQLAMMLTLMLSSKGVAGVPRASLVILLSTVASFNLPDWPVMAILGIDGLMDMARTSVNVSGNCLAAAVIARWEKCFVPNYESPFYDGHRPASP